MRLDKSKKLDELVESVETLLARLPDNATPGIAALREELDKSILETWTAVARERAEASAAIDDFAQSMIHMLRANRWIALGAVVALAGAAGFIAARATRRNYRP
ncbi:MAG: hypothetical protein M3O26_02460 [Pseudomonadota bacterium]|nr:hypothetical protein [Pseudomonadota bacterium]